MTNTMGTLSLELNMTQNTTQLGSGPGLQALDSLVMKMSGVINVVLP
jgi:hypothetical protein